MGKLSSTAAAARPRRRARRGTLLASAAVLLTTLLIGADSAEPTQASWTDAESVSSSFQSGVVSSPQHVACAFDHRWYEPDAGTFNNLVLSWDAPETHNGTVEPRGYRLNFVASGAAPQPKNSSIEIGSGSAYSGFGEHFTDPNPPFWAWQTNTHTYHIHLTTLGPGSWESDSWVIEAKISARILHRESSCTVVKVPEGNWGAVTFSGDHTEELLEEEEELLEDELDEDESAESPTPAPSPTDTETRSETEETKGPGRPSESPEPEPEVEADPPGPAEIAEDAEQADVPSPEPTTPSGGESESPVPNEPGPETHTEEPTSSDTDDSNNEHFSRTTPITIDERKPHGT